MTEVAGATSGGAQSSAADRGQQRSQPGDLYVIYIQIRSLITLIMLIQGLFSVSNP